MISKAKSCPGGTALFLYVMNENKGYELFRNKLSGETAKELYSEMAIIQRQNLRCDNNTLSIVLSPAIKDSSKLSDANLRSITEEILNERNLNPKSSQFLVFVHTEKNHKHLHILLNRVSPDGKLYNDYKISKKFQDAAHLIAKKYGLVSARDIKEAKERDRKQSTKKIREEIKKAHYYIIKRKPRNLALYKQEMLKFNIDVKPTINRQGNIQGFRFVHLKTNIDLKASEVDRKLRLHKLYPQVSLFKGENQVKNASLKEFKLNTQVLHSFLSELDYYFEKDPKKNKNRGRKR